MFEQRYAIVLLFLSVFVQNVIGQFTVKALSGHETKWVAQNPEVKSRDAIRRWITSIRREIPTGCIEKKTDKIDPEQQLVRFVDCNEPGATNKFAFSGKVDSNGRFSGKGTLEIRDTLEPNSKFCIKVRPLFDETIVKIKSKFYEGEPSTKAVVLWSNGLKGELLLQDGGVPQGVYRVERGDVWAVGHLLDGKVDGDCWIGSKNFAIFTLCEHSIWSISPKNSSWAVVFTHNFDISVAGYADQNSTRTMSNVREFRPLITNREKYSCFISVFGETYGRRFQLNLSNFQRNYFIESQKDVDHCANIASATVEGTEAIYDSAMAYFANFHGAISLDPSPIDIKKGRKFMTHVMPVTQDDEGNTFPDLYEASFNLMDSVILEFRYFGERDDEGRFHGQALMRPTSTSTLSSSQKSCIKGICKEDNFGLMFGTFDHGILQGLFIINGADEESYTFFIIKDNIVHSMVVEHGLRPIYPHQTDTDHTSNGFNQMLVNNGIGFLARFRNGRRLNPVWQGMIGLPIEGQGFLFGNVDKLGQISGENVAYIYPDYSTALVGTFENRFMKSAREAKVIRIKCEDGIIVPEFELVEENKDVYFYDQATNVTMSTSPLLRDPYEAKTIELGTSTIPGAGDGIFAKRDIPVGQLVAIYNGMVYVKEQSHIRTVLCTSNKSPAEAALCHKYRIHGYRGALHDIPIEWDNMRVYNATLAHKVNNQFDPLANAFFCPLEHPRFGLVVSVFSNRDIKKGEEIFVDYGYKKRVPGETDWYYEQKEKAEKKFREEEEAKAAERAAAVAEGPMADVETTVDST